MLKKILAAIFLFFALLFPPSGVYAQDQFFIDANVTYEVHEDANTQVIHDITIENRFSDLYATSYSLNLKNIDPEKVEATQEGEAVPLTVTRKNDSFLITIQFEDKVVGKGESRTFRVVYEDDGFATRTGEVWEISIPRLSGEESFRAYSLTLKTPVSFGKESYISPQPVEQSQEAGFRIFRFGKEDVTSFGISAGFGEFQVFSFTLNYHLENPLSRSAEVDIAIPPDTAFQKMYYEVIDPKPDRVSTDPDGNWLATYVLGPRERVDVTASGSVQIFSTPRELDPPTSTSLFANLQSTEYWQTTDPVISSLAERLGTPHAIYDYTTNTLSYDYERVRPNVDRMGASMALENPSQAICMEYTDLFIALARAAGIPAREINGYAYTENPEIQPLSLVADVLHAWPEYWDEEKEVWVPVDPTWASTTGGVDFFNKLDLRHFTFVIHGQSPTKPYPPGSYKLGPNPQKDVYVNFGQLPKEKNTKPKITGQITTPLPFIGSTLTIDVSNPGPSALYDMPLQVFFDDSLTETFNLESLPPYSSESFTVKIPFSFLGTKTPEEVTMIAADSRLTVPTKKSQIIIYSLIGFFLLLIFIILIVFAKAKGITFQSLESKVKSLFNKNAGKTNQTKTDQKGG